MAYNKKTWKDGDVITAEDLNNLEEGVSENEKLAETHASRHKIGGEDPITPEDIGLKPETWTLTYEDGTIETKEMYVG